MDINYELYKMFYKVAKAGSFTRVAEENFISQSAVTQAMKKLENQLGGTLFIRAKTGVTLTPEGETLYEYINESLETLNSAENLFYRFYTENLKRVFEKMIHRNLCNFYNNQCTLHALCNSLLSN